MHEVKACNTRFLHAAAPYVQVWTMVLQSSHLSEMAKASLVGRSQLACARVPSRFKQELLKS